MKDICYLEIIQNYMAVEQKLGVHIGGYQRDLVSILGGKSRVSPYRFVLIDNSLTYCQKMEK